MSEQRILTNAEWNEVCREAEAERHAPLECCCENGGKPFLLDGVWVTSRNAGCIVHTPPPQTGYANDDGEPTSHWSLRRFAR